MSDNHPEVSRNRVPSDLVKSTPLVAVPDSGRVSASPAPTTEPPPLLTDHARLVRVRVLADAAIREQTGMGVAREILMIPAADLYAALGKTPPVVEPAPPVVTGQVKAGSDNTPSKPR